MKSSVFKEVSPLRDKDCLLVFSRTKKSFTYPIHIHNVYELNYIQNAKGASRIVGNTISEIDDYELALITNTELEHAWLDGEMVKDNRDIKEITIQFHPDLFKSLLNKNQFKMLAKLFEDASRGVSFSKETILKLVPQIEAFTKPESGLLSVVNLIVLLDALSRDSNYEILSTSVNTTKQGQDDRIEKAFQFINDNYQQSISLNDVASLVGMTDVAFSRFIKQRTGKNFIDILNDLRIAKVIQQLINTTETISQICYSCGFNNISNFNRLFLQKKSCTPREFRQNYWKNRIRL